MEMSKGKLLWKKFIRLLLKPVHIVSDWLYKLLKWDNLAFVLIAAMIIAGVIWAGKPLWDLLTSSLILIFGLCMVVVLVSIFLYPYIDLVLTVIISAVGTMLWPLDMLYERVNEEISEYYNPTIRTYIMMEENRTPIGVIYKEK